MISLYLKAYYLNNSQQYFKEYLLSKKVKHSNHNATNEKLEKLRISILCFNLIF